MLLDAPTVTTPVALIATPAPTEALASESAMFNPSAAAMPTDPSLLSALGACVVPGALPDFSSAKSVCLPACSSAVVLPSSSLPPSALATALAAVVADDTALLYRVDASRWEGIADTHEPAIARRYLGLFTEIWEASVVEQELRELHV